MENKLNIKEYLDKDEQKDLLRLLTAGSVDDGKSTLIGRLLFDSKKLYEDQLAALERDSKRVGNAGDHIDYALLCDGLKAEREQGITIDVAYRYFSTNNRKFIIADTPGHEQYTPQYDYRRFYCQSCHNLGRCSLGCDYADLPPYFSGIFIGNKACGAGGEQDGSCRVFGRAFQRNRDRI